MKKITPTHDLSWYIKWVSSALILISIIFRSMDDEGLYRIYDLSFGLAGTIGWLTVGMLWHDRAMIMLNAAITMFLMMGIVNSVT